MPLPRAMADGLLESEVLLAGEEKETPYGGLVVRPPKYGIRDDTDAAAGGDRIGGVPSGSRHGPDDLRLRPDESDIDRVTRMPVGRVGDALDGGQRRMIAEINPPDPRRKEVGGDRPCSQQPENDLQAS
jgi:hypothetical protein